MKVRRVRFLRRACACVQADDEYRVRYYVPEERSLRTQARASVTRLPVPDAELVVHAHHDGWSDRARGEGRIGEVRKAAEGEAGRAGTWIHHAHTWASPSLLSSSMCSPTALRVQALLDVALLSLPFL